MSDGKLYMVEFVIMHPYDEDLVALIPKQREKINELFLEGKLMSYSLNESKTRLWAIFRIDGESELIYTIDSLPLMGFMDYTYHELLFHNSLHMIPTMSLN